MLWSATPSRNSPPNSNTIHPVPSHRQERVRELLRREIGEAIRREIPVHKAGLITVNQVLPAADLRQARVLLGVFGSTEQQKTALQMLEASKMRIQDIVAKSVILKYTPRLKFELDDTVEKANSVLRIIDELEKQPPPQPE